MIITMNMYEAGLSLKNTNLGHEDLLNQSKALAFQLVVKNKSMNLFIFFLHNWSPFQFLSPVHLKIFLP